MPTLKNWDEIPPELRDRIADGEAAIQRIDARETFFDWLRVGAALTDMQQVAMRMAGTNQPIGKAYNQCYAEVAGHAPKLASIDKATRSYAIWMAANRQTVEEWHASLPLNKKRSLNHPRAIRRSFEIDKRPPTEEMERKPHKTKEDVLDNAVTRIENAADTVERVSGGTVALTYDMTPELIKESAQNFVEVYGREDALSFARILIELLSPSQEPVKPFDLAFAQSLTGKRRRRPRI
jgi:hypothetical protein